MHKSILFVLLLNISFLSSASAQPWHRDNRAMGVAALSVAATSALTAGVSWWAYKKYSSKTKAGDIDEVAAIENSLPTVREIYVLNEQMLQSHLLEFGKASKRRDHFLPQMKAKAAFVPKLDLSKPINQIEEHDASSCPFEEQSHWISDSAGTKLVRTVACKEITDGYNGLQAELTKYVDSQQAIVTKEKQTLDTNKALENKKWWAKAIGITSSIVSLASLGIYGWSYFKAQKTSK